MSISYCGYYLWTCSLFIAIYLSTNVVADNCTYQDIRLYNVSNDDFGIVQLCNSSGQWEAVCDLFWDCRESIIACNQLGYQNTTPVYKVNYGAYSSIGFGPYYCSSSSLTSLFSCSTYSSYTSNINYCNAIRDTVGLSCMPQLQGTLNCISGSIRLVDGQSPREGRIQYCINGQWHPYCTRYGLTQKTASLICQELGFTQSYPVVFGNGIFGADYSFTYFRYIVCYITATTLSQCSIYVQTSSCPIDCSSFKQYGIRCFEPGNCKEGDVRLVNGTVVNEGRIEICLNGIWGSICGLGSYDSIVICKQLGHYNGAIVHYSNIFGDGGGPAYYINVCTGQENQISKCSKLDYFSTPDWCSSRNNIVGITCRDGCRDGAVRLTGGSTSKEGTVEICYDDIWGLVSQSGWDNNATNVVCKQLGYSGQGHGSVYNSTFGKPNRTIYLTYVHCTGDEDELDDCNRHENTFHIGKFFIHDAEVIGVHCQESASNDQNIFMVEIGTALIGLGVITIIIGIIVIFCASCQYRRLLKSMKQYQASSPSASPSHNNAMITSSAPAGHNKAVGATSLPTTDNPSYQSLGKPTEKYTHTPKLFHEYAYPY